MSKILEATCENGEVTCETQTIEDAEILSEGVKSSEGVLVIEEKKKTYIASNATDIKDLINALSDCLDKIVTIATGLDAVTTPPATQAANIAQLVTLNATLDAIKDNLK